MASEVMRKYADELSRLNAGDVAMQRAMSKEEHENRQLTIKLEEDRARQQQKIEKEIKAALEPVEPSGRINMAPPPTKEPSRFEQWKKRLDMEASQRPQEPSGTMEDWAKLDPRWRNNEAYDSGADKRGIRDGSWDKVGKKTGVDGQKFSREDILELMIISEDEEIQAMGKLLMEKYHERRSANTRKSKQRRQRDEQ